MACTPEEVAAVKEHLSSMGEDVCNLSATNAVSRLIAHGKKMKNRYDAARAVMSLSAEDDTDGVQPGLLAEARRVLHIRVPAAATPARAEQQTGVPRTNPFARAAATPALAADVDADGVQPDLLAEARRVLHIGERAPLALADDLTGGRWVTINGAHVYIKDGRVVAGPSRLLEKTHEPPEATPDQLYEVCFAAGTLVVMKGGGAKTIETIEAGEWVMSVPDTEPTSDPRPARVLRVFHNEPTWIWHAKVRDAIIRTTANHPFYVKDKGWIPAAKLVPGDQLRTIQREWAEVEGVEESGITAAVFNLQVEETKTYFVIPGDSGAAILVHNESTPAQVAPPQTNPVGGGTTTRPSSQPASSQPAFEPVPEDLSNAQLDREIAKNKAAIDELQKQQAAIRKIRDALLEKEKDPKCPIEVFIKAREAAEESSKKTDELMKKALREQDLELEDLYRQLTGTKPFK